MASPASVSIVLREGESFTRDLYWAQDTGSVLWSSAVVHVVNDVVRAFPAVLDALGAQLYYRCTTAGTSAATQPAFSTLSNGQTISDGTAVWTAQADSTFPVLLTNATVRLVVRASPEDTSTPAFDSSVVGAGVSITNASLGKITVTLTQSQVAAVLAALPGYGFGDILVTFAAGATPQHPFQLLIETARSATRS